MDVEGNDAVDGPGGAASDEANGAVADGAGDALLDEVSITASNGAGGGVLTWLCDATSDEGSSELSDGTVVGGAASDDAEAASDVICFGSGCVMSDVVSSSLSVGLSVVSAAANM